MRKDFCDDSWIEYLYWIKEDKNILKRINQILDDIDRNPYSGIGKPKQLRGRFAGWWSRRIDDKHRLIYRIVDDSIEICSCKGHYDDK